MHIAALRSNVEAVERLLALSADVTAVDDFGNSALHLAFAARSEDAIRALVAAKADPAALNKVMRVPGSQLSCLCQANVSAAQLGEQLHGAAFVRAARGDSDSKLAETETAALATSQQATPLGEAILKRQLVKVKELLAAKADANEPVNMVRVPSLSKLFE